MVQPFRIHVADEVLERVYNIQRWTVFPRGGHFAPAGEVAAEAGDLTAFSRDLR